MVHRPAEMISDVNSGALVLNLELWRDVCTILFGFSFSTEDGLGTHGVLLGSGGRS